MFSHLKKLNLEMILFVTLILFFLVVWMYARFFMFQPLVQVYETNAQHLEALKDEQKNHADLLEKITEYRNGLYGLRLILDARNQIIKSSDEENAFYVFNLSQLMNELRLLIPNDARATKFQITDQGLITLPIESVNYASLGRTLKRFKEQSSILQSDSTPKMFLDVFIPSGVQRSLVTSNTSESHPIRSQYSFVLQATLNPEYWKKRLPYSDMDPSAFYSNAIFDLSEAGLLKGYPDQTFRPLEPLTLNQSIRLLMAFMVTHGLLKEEEVQSFLSEDLASNSNLPLEWAQKRGWISSDFMLSDELSRQQALELFFKALRVSSENSSSESQAMYEVMPFMDIQLTDKDFERIKMAHQKGYLDYLNQEFNPQTPLTRGEFVYWIWKFKNTSLKPAQ